jgi:hypothetical protein
MAEQAVRKLYEQYLVKRSLKLNVEQFESFLAFYPALLVVASDGIVDKEEWLYCRKMASGLGNSFSEDTMSMEETNRLTAIYRTEFKYLLDNLEEWKDPFLDTLKVYLDHNSYAKQFVNETAHLFAQASKGVSDEEADTIQVIEKRLELT